MVPLWLHVLSIASLLVALGCMLWVLADVLRHPQRMGIMNLVWPISTLYGSVPALMAYRRYGRPAGKGQIPFPVMVAKGAAHCGSGCTVGDILAEWLVFFVPAVAVALGWKSIFADRIFAIWVADYILAFLFGIAFQYFTIAPMRGLSLGQGLRQAVKADVLSLTAWQLGMYGFMAVAHSWLFKSVLGVRLEVASPEFWFMMQIAMWCGLATSYPVNWWLIQTGVKERM